jgi:hypothetical protein
MTARDTRRGGVARYRVHPVTSLAIPLTVAGLYAVYVPVGQETRIYYCEPATGRCSCGAGAAPCPHIAVVRARVARADPDRFLQEDVA